MGFPCEGYGMGSAFYTSGGVAAHQGEDFGAAHIIEIAVYGMLQATGGDGKTDGIGWIAHILTVKRVDKPAGKGVAAADAVNDVAYLIGRVFTVG